MKLLYLVHDLGDAAVGRRVRFLRDGGAQVDVIGFLRKKAAGSPATETGIAIGHTRDGRLLRRVASMIQAIAGSARWHETLEAADVVIARSLEMLLIAVLVRKRLRLAIPIVYECLDIHRLMTGRNPVGFLLRLLERHLLRASSLLIVSSPRFIDSYFVPFQGSTPRWLLLENKLLLSELDRLPAGLRRTEAEPGLPWRIGWFGVIRCRRSLELLANVVRTSNGTIEVDIRGRPARDVVPEFDAVVASTDGMQFGGAYDRATDLAAMYGRVHFNWAIDFYEDGLNSAWLLPNRLYEGSMFGSVPLALASVETGRWLSRHGCGLLLETPLEHTLPALFASMTAELFDDAQRRVAALDPDLLMETPATASAFVSTLAQLGARTRSISPTLSRARTT